MSCHLLKILMQKHTSFEESELYVIRTIGINLTLACVQGYMNLMNFFAVYGTLCKETGTPFRY